MNIAGFELWQVFDIIILLLIGMGPKIALVPFVDMTAGFDSNTRKQVAKKMITNATTWALILVVLGAFLMKLLHFSEEALYIAGGIFFLLIALHMLVAGGDDKKHKKVTKAEAIKTAQYPLAVPYLLNPVGITMMIIFSAAIDSISMLGLFIGLVILMALFDWLIFSNLDGLMKHLDKSRLAVTEAIFGVLLSALAVELVLIGLSNLGIIEAVVH
jgi:multiple antibiotic resistance protein